ncbi:MAG: hypothetical protein ACXVEF_34775 [Polyangiales bacterium]
MSLLDEGSTPDVPATQKQLDLWIKAGGIEFNAWHDPPGVGQRIQTDLAPKETAFLVELSTMKVLAKQTAGLDKLYAKLDTL